jgi:hypothetical protein
MTTSLKETSFEVEDTLETTTPPYNFCTKSMVESLHKL